ncbi:hypothetical protein K402DRAFT_393299 [Aulographum hederae CBS 113979]|uniref:Uncharacterized protein n=1 Tax=Aulographum hederae CBS 113979 TaxID=1176131 RepID=A0A6G1H1Q7_9PEZI|nr:hypothetical protein K402DRAFT_393299 [Aulographum hederae CBS 113979]
MGFRPFFGGGSNVTELTRLGLSYHWQANHLTRSWISDIGLNPDIRAELRRDPRPPPENTRSAPASASAFSLHATSC